MKKRLPKKVDTYDERGLYLGELPLIDDDHTLWIGDTRHLKADLHIDLPNREIGPINKDIKETWLAKW